MLKKSGEGEQPHPLPVLKGTSRSNRTQLKQLEMEEMSQPDEEEWESYREDTKELGRCNVSEVKGICTQPGLRACDTLDCQLGSLRTVSGKPLPQ